MFAADSSALQQFLTTQEAYQRVLDNSELVPQQGYDRVTIKGRFDLGMVASDEATASEQPLRFFSVDFEEQVIVSRAPSRGVEFNNCSFTKFESPKNTAWVGPLRFIESRVATIWKAEKNHFVGGLSIENTSFDENSLFIATGSIIGDESESIFRDFSLRSSRLPKTVGLTSIEVNGVAHLDRIIAKGPVNLSGSVFIKGLRVNGAQFKESLNLRQAVLMEEVTFRGSSVKDALFDDIRPQSNARINFAEFNVKGRLCLGETAAAIVDIDWWKLGKAVLDCHPSDEVILHLAKTADDREDKSVAQAIRDRRSKPGWTSRHVLIVASGSGVILSALGYWGWLLRTRSKRVVVFISYRRRSTWSVAASIEQGLQSRRINVFLDVEGVGVGRYAEQLERAVKLSDMILVVIDDVWAQGVKGSNERLLFREGDWCRRELELALEAGSQIVPVLVEQAELPRREDLPPTIASLVDFQGVRLRSDTWKSDIANLRSRILDHARTGGTRVPG